VAAVVGGGGALVVFVVHQSICIIYVYHQSIYRHVCYMTTTGLHARTFFRLRW
jgi:hypothetical protein